MSNDPDFLAWRERKRAENNWHGFITGKSLAPLRENMARLAAAHRKAMGK